MPDNSISGLGDISLGALFTPWYKEDSPLSRFEFSLDVILPTGDAKDQPIVNGGVPSVFQLGTGTTQLGIGTRYAFSFGEWTSFSSLGATFPLYESSENFRPAETFYASTGVGHKIVGALDARLSLSLFHGENDEFGGESLDFTGSTTLSIVPSLVYRVSDSLAISGTVSIPVYREVNTTQLVSAPLWQLGMSYSF